MWVRATRCKGEAFQGINERNKGRLKCFAPTDEDLPGCGFYLLLMVDPLWE
jgi:hypothetical protein